ncbi:MAG: GFA family protein [Pseudomonadota bacterium]|nr:GFA family protein [Pseudomonadota bacterium]|tara:strand:- start:637 stop:1050 length:414 start_codon:yes stop_codon:yes gene_type:complete
MKIDGGCLCRHITYEAVVDPDKVAICHCTDCQTHSGTAFGVVVGITDGQFHLRSGTLKTFEKIADSGTRRALAFCPECGTRIHARTVGEGSSFFGLRLGTVNQRDQLTPKRQVWSRSAQGWLPDLESIPKFEKQPKM